METIISQPQSQQSNKGQPSQQTLSTGAGTPVTRANFNPRDGWGQVRFDVAQRRIRGKKHNLQQLTGSSILGVLRQQKRHSEKQLKGSQLVRRNSSKSKVFPILTVPQSSLAGHNFAMLQDKSQEDAKTPLSINKDAGDIPLSDTGNEKGQKDARYTAQTGDVKVNLLDKGPKPAPLLRRKSLNPRVMTPPGLEVLNGKSMVAIRQQMEMDITAGCGSPNTYKVWDMNDEQLFFGAEESSCCCRWMCGPNRKLSLELFSTSDDLVMSLHRSSCRCDCCCCLDCFLCLQKIYVVDCLGRTLGTIKQKFSIFNAKFDIVDHDENVLFKIIGPCCPCRCCTEVNFQILNKTGERVIGRIFKKWGGDRLDQVNVDHEYFDITFPVKLDEVDKALIIGGAFLINFLYLEMS